MQLKICTIMPKYAIEICIKYANICRNRQHKTCNNMQIYAYSVICIYHSMPNHLQ